MYEITANEAANLSSLAEAVDSYAGTPVAKFENILSKNDVSEKRNRFLDRRPYGLEERLF